MGYFRITLSGPGTTAIGDLAGSAVEMLQSAVDATAAGLLPFLKEVTPVSHGRTFDGSPIMGGALRNSLQWQVGELGAILLGRGYGAFVVGGTAPHVIRPRAARALAFWWTRVGRGVMYQRVNHPGTQANDFRQIGVQAAVDANVLTQALEPVLSDWLDGVGASV